MYYSIERKNGNSIKKPNMTGSFITQRYRYITVRLVENHFCSPPKGKVSTSMYLSDFSVCFHFHRTRIGII